MGLAGELSSMVLSRRSNRLVSGMERGTSDSNSELIFKPYDSTTVVDIAFKPHKISQIEQIYLPVEPSNLISKQ